MKKISTALLCIVLFISCEKKIDVVTPPLSSEKEVLSMVLVFGRDTVSMVVLDSTIEGIRTDTTRMDSSVAMFQFAGTKIMIEGVEQISGTTIHNFKEPLTYLVQAEDGSTRSYKLKLRTFTGLPILYITSPPISSKDNYVDGTLVVDGNTDFANGSYKMQIKGRGNSTWGNPKNPYKIKLSQKSGLLGMPADKEWALLANWFDKSLLRNDLGFELSERMDMKWTPRRRLVEVFLNGQYNGNYLLTETVKVATDRLNVQLMDAKNPSDTTGAYLLEADFRMDGLQTFATKWGARFSMKDPEQVTEEQMAYITNQWLTFEDNIRADNDLSTMIDVDSWIKWTIVNEVMRNRDAVLFGSEYFYQGASQKLFMGPVWDFDLSSGGYVDNDPTGWYVTTSNLVGEAFKSNKPYKKRFREIWNEYKTKIRSITDYLDQQETIMKYSQVQNYERWEVFATPLFDGQITNASYVDEIHYLRNWFTTRIAWIDKELN